MPNPEPTLMTAAEGAEQARLIAEAAELAATNSEAIATLKRQLMSQAERDGAPDTITVTDLESRLRDSEAAREAEKGIVAGQLEQLRLAIAGGQAHRIGQPESDRCVFGDLEHAKKTIHEWAGAVSGDTREIDTTVISSAGALPDEVAESFFQFTTDQAFILGRVQTIRMLNAVRQLDELRIAAGKLRKTAENTALALSDSATTAQRTLTAIGTGWTESISLEFLEENIEREGATGTIAAAVGRQYANDVADLGWNGDATTAGIYLTNVGWMGQILGDADVTDTDLVGITTSLNTGIFLKMQKLMPSRFLTLPGMAFTVPVASAFAYANELASRATSLGDGVIVSGLPGLTWFGVPVVAEPYFNSAIAGFETADAVVLTPNDNLVYGVMRDIETFLEFKPRTRLTELTIHARSDYNHINGLMIVNGINLDATLR